MKDLENDKWVAGELPLRIKKHRSQERRSSAFCARIGRRVSKHVSQGLAQLCHGETLAWAMICKHQHDILDICACRQRGHCRLFGRQVPRAASWQAELSSACVSVMTCLSPCILKVEHRYSEIACCETEHGVIAHTVCQSEDEVQPHQTYAETASVAVQGAEAVPQLHCSIEG